ncbi:MAG: MFS transporter [Anaerolineae bacterium]
MTPKETTSAADIVTLTFTRLVMNMTRRFSYPFLPEISRQLSVPLDSVQNVMAVNAGVGVASPLLGAVGERYGRKRVMMVSLLSIIVASLLGALAPQFALFAAVMVVFGVAKMIFDPVMSAYIADHVPYVRRGAVVGITELSWAGSLLVIAPIAGFLLGTSGLSSVLMVVALFGVAALVAVYRYLPADHPTGDAAPRRITPLETWRALRKKPAAFGALGFSLLMVIANETFFINYSAYMESTFNLALTALGTVTIVVAAAEVFGELSVAGFADRFGKRRLTLIGAGVSSLSYIVLPLFSSSLPLTLVTVFVMFLALETAIVASIPLFTELLPHDRAIMMSALVGTNSLGRLAGAVFGGWLYAVLANFPLTTVIVTGIALVSFFLLWRFLPEKQD